MAFSYHKILPVSEESGPALFLGKQDYDGQGIPFHIVIRFFCKILGGKKYLLYQEVPRTEGRTFPNGSRHVLEIPAYTENKSYKITATIHLSNVPLFTAQYRYIYKIPQYFPPSIKNVCPVRYDVYSEERNATKPPKSSGFPICLTGMDFFNFSSKESYETLSC